MKMTANDLRVGDIVRLVNGHYGVIIFNEVRELIIVTDQSFWTLKVSSYTQDMKRMDKEESAFNIEAVYAHPGQLAASMMAVFDRSKRKGLKLKWEREKDKKEVLKKEASEILNQIVTLQEKLNNVIEEIGECE